MKFGIFDALTTLLMLAGAFSFINYRFIRLPTNLGVMLIGLLLSLALITVQHLNIFSLDSAYSFLASFNFSNTLLYSFLSFLLFAGALHVDIQHLRRHKLLIAFLSTGGVLFSSVFIGIILYGLLQLLGLPCTFYYCLAFGALISPTDPVVVLNILRPGVLPENTRITLVGESLFNDAFAIVLFLLFTDLATSQHSFVFMEVVMHLVWQVVGGVFLGLVAGALAIFLLRQVQDFHVESLLTLGLTASSYDLAHLIHASAPMTTVVMGLMVGNYLRNRPHMPSISLRAFWDIIDELLNAFLFIMVGLQMLILPFSFLSFVAGILTVLLVFAGRYVTVKLPLTVSKKWGNYPPNMCKHLTLGGIRGGISLAMALSLPSSAPTHVILGITYITIVTSIIGQGLYWWRESLVPALPPSTTGPENIEHQDP